MGLAAVRVAASAYRDGANLVTNAEGPDELSTMMVRDGARLTDQATAADLNIQASAIAA
jgi:hypothetical protein